MRAVPSSSDSRRRARRRIEKLFSTSSGEIPSNILDWFQTNGWTPFEFQRATWRAYAAGKSGLVHAPTGVGKTYAVWLGPVIEYLDTAHERMPRAPQKLRRANTEPLRVLWITPLKALAADTAAALRVPIDALKLPWSIESRTGDTSATLRARQRERLPTALITTPESLSLFLSRPTTREAFQSLRCVIVDEWHELLSTKRGVQTELGLARLRQWLPDLRIWGLSATLANLEQARDVLLGHGARAAANSGVLISGDMPKEYRVETIIPSALDDFPWSGHLGMSCLSAVLEAIERGRTTLLFTNTRSQAEIWFRAIVLAKPDWLGKVALHHGSLERGIRSRVESMLRQGALRCVVCTSSLDLGVDFSPVDQVIQLGSPKGIARLMQRAGRSGHQPGVQSKVLCAPTHAFELVEFAAARAAVAARAIEPRVPLLKPLDLLAQHIVTIAIGGGFRADELLAEVRGSHSFANLTQDEWNWTLEFATHGGPALRNYDQHARIVQVDGHFVVSSKRIERMHRMSIGTITSDMMMTVRSASGRTFGTIEEGFISRLQSGDVFVFAGRTMELVQVRGMAAIVRLVKRAKGIVPRWNGARFPLSTQLAAAVRQKLNAAREGDFSDPELRAVRPLIAVQVQVSIVPEPDQLLIEHSRSREGWHYFVFSFEGRLANEGLAALLAYRISQRAPRTLHVSANDYGIELLSPTELHMDERAWAGLLTLESLTEDLLACLNVTQLARRQFRDIARIAGLVLQGFPGAPKPARHLQASSELFFDVFTQFDPENRLLDQARREVLEQQLEIGRIRAALERTGAARLVFCQTQHFSPLAFPLWAERLRTQQISSEKWADRVKRMAATLNRAAQQATIDPKS